MRVHLCADICADSLESAICNLYRDLVSHLMYHKSHSVHSFLFRFWQRVMRLTFLCLLTISTVAAKRRPHIIMVVADDLGWNDVSFHGSTQIPTPTLDKLANDGVQLNNYYVQPVCSPTRSCLLTGRHVIHSGIYDPDCGQGTTYAVPLNFTMLPRHLKAFNYEVRANAAYPAQSCLHRLRECICSLMRNVFTHPSTPFSPS